MLARCTGSAFCGWKFRNPEAGCDGFLDMFRHGIVVARQRQVAIAAQLEQLLPVLTGVTSLHVHPLFDYLCKILVTPLLVALGVSTEFFDIHPLPLSGSVVH